MPKYYVIHDGLCPNAQGKAKVACMCPVEVEVLKGNDNYVCIKAGEQLILDCRVISRQDAITLAKWILDNQDLMCLP